MVFQNYALYPHMSVAENMGFALKIARVQQVRDRRRVFARPRKILDLEEYLDRKPGSSPAASASASRWAARSSASPACS